jgi:hypothetical protein
MAQTVATADFKISGLANCPKKCWLPVEKIWTKEAD